MRCWKLLNQNLLLEEPYDVRMTTRDPLTFSEEALFLETVNARLAETGQGAPLEAFRSYYEVDEAGALKAFYEPYGYSDEDELLSFAFVIIENSLCEFSMSRSFDGDMELTTKVLFSELVSAPPPIRIASAR